LKKQKKRSKKPNLTVIFVLNEKPLSELVFFSNLFFFNCAFVFLEKNKIFNLELKSVKRKKKRTYKIANLIFKKLCFLKKKREYATR